MKVHVLETAIERLGRILANQYNIGVIYEGNQAKTDGKNIYLPRFENVTEEIYNDMIAYLDHEVAHCKFTEFPEVSKVISRFHKELLNATEDSRIEQEMFKEYPGAQSFLDPLNEKLMKKIHDKWESLPWPIRLIIGVRDLMEKKAPRLDPDTKDLFETIKDKAAKLSECTSTKEIRVATEEIVKLIEDKREEIKKEKEKKEAEKAKGKKGEKGEKGQKSEQGDESDDGGEGDDMLSEKANEQDSAFDDHVRDVHSMVNEEIKDAIKKEEKEVLTKKHMRTSDRFVSIPSTPFTTKYDKVTDFSGEGDARAYAALKRDVASVLNPVRQTLERVLKVQENAKWRIERERGKINARDLGKLASNKGYRTIFKDFTRTETNNLAVEILVDCSGSMSGKMHTAKQTAAALSEALRALDISFEVTGFSTTSSRADAGAASSRYTRIDEALDHRVYKSWDSVNLNGLSKMNCGANNADGESLLWAAKRLAERREKRKILIVLSDGMPATAGCSYEVSNHHLREAVKKVIKSGIEVIGIGIESDAPRIFYPKHAVVYRIGDLPKVAINELSKLILKGVK